MTKKINDDINKKMDINKKIKEEVDNYIEENFKNTIYENIKESIKKIHYENLIVNLENNEELKKKYINNEISIQQLINYKGYEFNYNRWKPIINKHESIKKNKNKISTTDLYTCSKCKNKKCSLWQQQTRGLDEPITTFVKCLNCGFSFKL